jgi:hypothetical protein
MNGFCEPGMGETCATCAPDCGACPSCGDHTCTASAGEDCFTCPGDCGDCPSCGDGRCRGTETCASCSADCGSCAFCGNMRCEADAHETCTNCAVDCGMCMLHSCSEGLTCLFGCFDFTGGGGGIPMINFTCLSGCVAETCPSSQVFLNNVANCAINAFVSGACGTGGGIGCITTECGPEITACFADRCR